MAASGFTDRPAKHRFTTKNTKKSGSVETNAARRFVFFGGYPAFNHPRAMPITVLRIPDQASVNTFIEILATRSLTFSR